MSFYFIQDTGWQASIQGPYSEYVPTWRQCGSLSSISIPNIPKGLKLLPDLLLDIYWEEQKKSALIFYLNGREMKEQVLNFLDSASLQQTVHLDIKFHKIKPNCWTKASLEPLDSVQIPGAHH